MADAFEKYVNERPEITPTIYAYKLNGVVCIIPQKGYEYGLS